MLTYQQLETIADILGWTVADVESAIAELNSGFMTPYIQDFMAGDLEGGITEDGYYSRLSAAGYLDCTDWLGPFETEEAAVAELLSAYAD